MKFSAIGIDGAFRVWETNQYSKVKNSFKGCGNANFLLFNYNIVKRTGPENKYFDELVSSYFKYLEIFNDKELAYNQCCRLCKAWENFGFNIGFYWQDVIGSLYSFYDETKEGEEE